MQPRKGLLLAGGLGTRLYPLTLAISKQLLPVFDKPMIYYPLTTLMLSGIREVLILSTPRDLPLFERLLGDGKQWGMEIQYRIQESPKGLPDAFIQGKDFLKGAPSALVLGDNLFYGSGLSGILQTASERKEAVIFGCQVKNPEQYGVVEFGQNGEVMGFVEKPKNPPSKVAVTGLYFYDVDAPVVAKELKPSKRGELEITEMHQHYLKKGNLRLEMMPRGAAWLDTGSFEGLFQATQFIQTLEGRQGLRVGCPEEVAWRMKYISDEALEKLAQPLISSGYGAYLLSLLEGKR